MKQPQPLKLIPRKITHSNKPIDFIFIVLTPLFHAGYIHSRIHPAKNLQPISSLVRVLVPVLALLRPASLVLAELCQGLEGAPVPALLPPWPQVASVRRRSLPA